MIIEIHIELERDLNNSLQQNRVPTNFAYEINIYTQTFRKVENLQNQLSFENEHDKE